MRPVTMSSATGSRWIAGTGSAPTRGILVLVLILGIAFSLFTAGGAAGADRLLAPKRACWGQAKTAAAPAAQEAAMLCLHKYARRKAGLRGIQMNAQLESSSAGKVHDVASCGFSHDACGRTFTYWFAVVGAGCGGYAENLAFGTGRYASAREAMRSWLSSRAHRANLLERRYRQIGVGLENGYWVAHYGYNC